VSRATISTHVLDVSQGAPAGDVAVTLAGQPVQRTDRDGRIADLTGGGIEPGSYQLVFELGAYFGRRPHLFEKVTVEIVVAEGRHYHIPLLISPYSWTSYRGS